MVSGHAQPREATAAVVRPSGTAGPSLPRGLAQRAWSEQPTPSCTHIGRVSHWKKTSSSVHIQFLKRPRPERRSVRGGTSGVCAAQMLGARVGLGRAGTREGLRGRWLMRLGQCGPPTRETGRLARCQDSAAGEVLPWLCWHQLL